MKTIISGSRSITGNDGLAEVEAAVAASGFHVTRVLCGCAKGVDVLGAAWAGVRGIPVEFHPAKWQGGPQAGDGLIAVWDGESPGTAHMIEEARRRGLRVHVHRVGAPAPQPQQEFAL
jgi:hypothetical protein